MNFRSTIGVLCGALLAAGSLGIAQAQAGGRLLLTGTDGWEFHRDPSYAQQVAALLGPNIAFLNDYGITGASVVAGVNVFGINSLPASLAGFTGINIASPGTCCSDPMDDPGMGISANIGMLTSFLAGGGNISIADFAGRPEWTPLLGFDPGAGIIGGVGSVGCSDPGVSTAAGVAAGFTGQSGSGTYYDSCFTHQAFSKTFFAAHGFTSLIDEGSGDYGSDASVVLSLGGVPEPSAWALMLVGFGLGGMALRSRRRAFA